MKKILNIILISVLLIIGLTFLLLLIERNKKVTLPAPTGKFAIGRTTFEWSDTSRLDSLAPEPGFKRELFIWVWYPASKTKTGSTSEYLPNAWREAVGKRQGIFARFLTRKLSKIHTNSIAGAQVLQANNQYPVVLIKSGLGALTTDYTTIAEDLASNGYVVVGADAPYSSSVVVFSGGRVINDNIKGNPGIAAPSLDRDRRLNDLVTMWTDDTRFILDKLEEINTRDSSNLLYHHLNLKKVGVFGHSMGGAAAFRFCFADPRCKAGVSIDGTPFGTVNENKLSKPFMFLMAETAGTRDSTSVQIKTNIDTIYSQLPESKVWINLKGAKHFNFTDQALIKERFIARKYGDLGTIGERRGLQITASCLRTFFDKNLKGISNADVQALRNQYSEIVLE